MQSATRWRQWLWLIGTIGLLIILAGCQAAPSQDSARAPSPSITAPEAANPAAPAPPDQAPPASSSFQVIVNWGQSYSSKDEVAAYIHQYHVLPPNYITKGEAQKRGWDSTKGNLWQVTDHQSIGGDVFGNREGLLLKAPGRQYFECDIDYYGGYRGAKRIIYSNDGLIFYTDDHYTTFSKLY